MTDGRRSFWSSIPGLITGVAGLLTGVVGLISLLVQQGIVGNSSSDKPASGVATTVAPGTIGAGATATTVSGSISVDQTSLRFTLAERTRTIKVTNTGAAEITIPVPKVSGDSSGQFSVAADGCDPLKPNLSCAVKVTFKPSGILNTDKATLQIVPSGPVRPVEVELIASAL